MGFIVHFWTIDEEAINYRHDDTEKASRYTKYEGYQPLRFVVSLPSRSLLRLDEDDVEDQISKIRQSCSRKDGRNRKFHGSRHSNVVIEEIN